MLIRCDDVSRLTTQSMDRPLGWREQLKVTVHRVFCPPCRFYRRQLETMRRMTASLDGGAEPTLDNDARARIAARLKAAQSTPESD